MHHILLSSGRTWALLLLHLKHAFGKLDALGKVDFDALQAQSGLLLDSAFAARQDNGRWLSVICFRSRTARDSISSSS